MTVCNPVIRLIAVKLLISLEDDRFPFLVVGLILIQYAGAQKAALLDAHQRDLDSTRIRETNVHTSILVRVPTPRGGHRYTSMGRAFWPYLMSLSRIVLLPLKQCWQRRGHIVVTNCLLIAFQLTYGWEQAGLRQDSGPPSGMGGLSPTFLRPTLALLYRRFDPLP